MQSGLAGYRSQALARVAQCEEKFKLRHLQLKEWQKARPFLWVSQDPYGTELVEEMISLIDSMLIHARASGEPDESFFRHLEAVRESWLNALNTPPPRHTPPTRKAPHAGLFLFIPPSSGGGDTCCL